MNLLFSISLRQTLKDPTPTALESSKCRSQESSISPLSDQEENETAEECHEDFESDYIETPSVQVATTNYQASSLPPKRKKQKKSSVAIPAPTSAPAPSTTQNKNKGKATKGKERSRIPPRELKRMDLRLNEMADGM